MDVTQTNSSASPFGNLRDRLPDLEKLYTHIHAHPELSMQETRTEGLAAERLRAAGCEVTTGVGKTGGFAPQRRWADRDAARRRLAGPGSDRRATAALKKEARN